MVDEKTVESKVFCGMVESSLVLEMTSTRKGAKEISVGGLHQKYSTFVYAVYVAENKTEMNGAITWSIVIYREGSYKETFHRL